MVSGFWHTDGSEHGVKDAPMVWYSALSTEFEVDAIDDDSIPLLSKVCGSEV